ncbi:HAMP domain-containing histidine kinase [Balneolaceae bacterium YR4-1]|uniref:histidine kinase n=1 Tax=Halalkalibaculum roseum TaxID=2709311 RepID=A0A6M1SS54_9BACT|nr:HAMP domain-containing sensor histidine kinase [Halalkalibaculum roseum]NGP75660.1 HAMP domain-containing histidine kinase [Halalkalibaculum roseum]
MDEELQIQDPASLAAEVNRQYLNLQPYIELAQHIMDAPVCEIHIRDAHYQDVVAPNVDEAVYKDLISYNAIRKNGKISEIGDLTNNKLYKDHSYVKTPPGFQYYCSAKLTTINGRDIGVIYVLDTKTKHVSNKQKEQFRYLAQLVMNAIEYENKYRGLASNLEALNDCFHKLNHDLRSPISGILGISDLLTEEKDNTEFPTQELTMIKESAETILDIIDEVLVDTKTGSNGHKKQEESSVEVIIEQLKHLYHPPAKAKGLSLKFVNHIDADLNVSHAFTLELLQIIGNLLSNAIKFTPENGAIETTITRETDKNKDILDITVTDNGKGMSADQIAAFNNGIEVTRSAGTNGEQSFGRGLTDINQMVTRTGGSISVKAGKNNNGTQFSISLPLPVDNLGKLLSSISLKEKTNPIRNGIK